MALREDLSDQHYSQLFFVIGHIAIKMLTYVEHLEAELKQTLMESFKGKEKKQKDSEESNDDKDQEDDLFEVAKLLCSTSSYY